MANEFNRPEQLMTLQFTIANVGAGTTPVDGVLAGSNGKTGYVVPTGYAFEPVYIDVKYNADRTAGSSVVKVTSSGTELANGPTATIDDDPVNANQGLAVRSDRVAAGAIVGVSATGDGSFAPTTADADVVLQGYLIQV